MSGVKNGPELHPDTVALARGKNFGSISTVLPGGRVQTHVIWVDTDGERLVVNTEVDLQKYRNILKDPRVTLMIRDEEDPYRYVEVRGTVDETVTGQVARDHIDRLSQKYHGEDYPPENIGSERVMLWIVPERQTILDQTNPDTGA